MSEPTLQTLADTLAITQLVARYGHTVDWLDLDGMKACFTADAEVSFGTMTIPAMGFCDFWHGLGSGFKARHHLLGTPLIALTGPDSARVEAPSAVFGTRADEVARARDFWECNRYHFDVVRDGGTWKIAKARVFITWSQGAPSSGFMESGGPLDHDATVANPLYAKF